MVIPRIPPDRASEFDLVVTMSVRRRGTFAEEPRAETTIRIPLGNVMAPNAAVVTDDVADAVLESITELVNKTAVVTVEEVPSGATADA